MLLNTYYHAMAPLRRPPAIAVYSTPVLGAVARATARRWPGLNRRLYFWQVGRFIRDPRLRRELVPRFYRDFGAAQPAFWRLNKDLLGTVLRNWRRRGELRRFEPPVTVLFGQRDRYLNPRVAHHLAASLPHSDLQLVPDAGHYVQVDRPDVVAAHLRGPVPSGNRRQ